MEIGYISLLSLYTLFTHPHITVFKYMFVHRHVCAFQINVVVASCEVPAALSV
jgi:hypothetical protein